MIEVILYYFIFVRVQQDKLYGYGTHTGFIPGYRKP